MITYGSTFSGIGGLDLAVEHVFGATPLWHVEPNPYAAAVLRRHWPNVPNLHRIEQVDGTTPRPTIICGGFPCQDISLAGAGAGLEGKRSGLWWELARVLEQLEPEVVVIENVAAIVARGLGSVLSTLARLGFDAEWSTLRAADVGAPHIRRRLFLVAASSRLSHADRLALRQDRKRQRARGAQTGELGRDGGEVVHPHGARRQFDGQQASPVPRGGELEDTGGALANADGQRRAGVGNVPARESNAAGRHAETLADSDDERREGLGSGGLQHEIGASLRDDAHRCCEAPRWPPGRGDHEAWARWPGAVPGVRRGAYGPPRGVDARARRERLRCLGNAVNPAQAALAILTLWGRLTAMGGAS